ncbi:hypothetical protein ABPG75_000454 [Micractinium tetrahymenae]
MAQGAHERLEAQGLRGGSQVVCSTVHSFCFKVLRMFHREAGFERPPTVLHTTRDLDRLVKLCYKLAKLNQLKEEVCSWLRLPATQTSWQGVFEDLWSSDEGRRLVQAVVAAAKTEVEARHRSTAASSRLQQAASSSRPRSARRRRTRL